MTASRPDIVVLTERGDWSQRLQYPGQILLGSGYEIAVHETIRLNAQVPGTESLVFVRTKGEPSGTQDLIGGCQLDDAACLQLQVPHSNSTLAATMLQSQQAIQIVNRDSGVKNHQKSIVSPQTRAAILRNKVPNPIAAVRALKQGVDPPTHVLHDILHAISVRLSSSS
jgi:hypothetical protein